MTHAALEAETAEDRREWSQPRLVRLIAGAAENGADGLGDDQINES